MWWKVERTLITNPQFFTLIIGTEILNHRRQDAHFDFVSASLFAKGYTLSGSFTIEDNPDLIVEMIKFISTQENAVLFCFGGIGSTPDDYTRQCVATALRDGVLYQHTEAKEVIENKLGKDAYPHAIIMADLPKKSHLLKNVINDMPAFFLDDRYFFMPGFPEMSHPMVETILDKMIPLAQEQYRHTLTAECKESVLIEVMKQMPIGIEFSALPTRYIEEGKVVWRVSISVSSTDALLSKNAFSLYVDTLDAKGIAFVLEDAKQSL